MRRILFVDDEPKVLDGLRRMLYSLRNEWQMEFAEGGPQALQRLAQSSFDAVVTDMRMPGMDGEELLQQVMHLYPETVRIVLSGQCDRETVLKTVDPAHQFLTKPCSPQTLKSTLVRACEARDQLQSVWHRRMVSQVTSVPSDPGCYAGLASELRSSNASLTRAAEIIASDVGMTAKIMQLVSSSFFGTPQTPADATGAALLFDLDTLRALVFSTRAFSAFGAAGIDAELADRLNSHSRVVAAGAKAIVLAEGGSPAQAGQAWLAGFLHDVGLLVLAQNVSAWFSEALATAVAEPLPLDEVERGATGETHAEVGAYLMALWGLPEAIVDTIAFHHRPRLAPSPDFLTLAAVHVASAIDSARQCVTAAPPDFLDQEFVANHGLTGRLDDWRQVCQSACQEELPA